MFFVLKVVISGVLIAYASWLAGRNPVAAGFIIALPLMSILSIFFSYLQYRDMEKINTFAVSIFAGIPLSLTFFIPFLMHRWFKMNFFTAYTVALGLLVLGFLIHHQIFQWIRH